MQINHHNLDQLLKLEFVSLDFSDKGNQKMLNMVAESNLQRSRAFSAKSIVLAAGTLVALVTAVLLISNTESPLVTEIPQAPEEPEQMSVPLVPHTNQKRELKETSAVVTHTRKPDQVNEVKKMHEIDQRVFIAENNEPASAGRQFGPEPDADTKTLDYVFPVLTEKEKKKNRSDKQKFIRSVVKAVREKSAFMPRVPASSDGQVAEFFMMGSEVTNKQYRVFLYDLLICGRKEEFLRAKPHQSLWVNVEGLNRFNHFEKDYFSGSGFDDFPVVNISAEGAELFCRWVQDETDSLRLKDSKIPALHAGLPTPKEWVYAASGGVAGAKYPWLTDSIQNRHNMFMANFCIQKDKHLLRQPIGKHQLTIDEETYTSAGLILREKNTGPVLVWCYNPNNFGLYATSGNASELVKEGGLVIVKGGSWADAAEQLTIGSEEMYNGPSPKTGFRMLVRVAK